MTKEHLEGTTTTTGDKQSLIMTMSTTRVIEERSFLGLTLIETTKTITIAVERLIGDVLMTERIIITKGMMITGRTNPIAKIGTETMKRDVKTESTHSRTNM